MAKERVITDTMSTLQESPRPQVDESGEAVSKEILMQVLKEDWFKPFTIRDFHYKVYK